MSLVLHAELADSKLPFGPVSSLRGAPNGQKVANGGPCKSARPEDWPPKLSSGEEPLCSGHFWRSFGSKCSLPRSEVK